MARENNLDYDPTKKALPDYFPEGINRHIIGYLHDPTLFHPKYAHDQQYRSLKILRAEKWGKRPKGQSDAELDKRIKERIAFLDQHIASKKNGGIGKETSEMIYKSLDSFTRLNFSYFF